MKSQNLTSSQFADKLGVQRSGLSHILSGRNKPSLDFVLKVLAGFPDLNPQWLLQGKGKMYVNMAGVSEAQKVVNPGAEQGGSISLLEAFSAGASLPVVEPAPAPETPAYDNEESLTDALLNMRPQPEQAEQAEPEAAPIKKAIARIVLFYNDGTFAEFQPEQPTQPEQPETRPEQDGFRLD